MSSQDDNSLSLKSLFAFVDGFDSHPDKPYEPVADDPPSTHDGNEVLWALLGEESARSSVVRESGDVPPCGAGDSVEPDQYSAADMLPLAAEAPDSVSAASPTEPVKLDDVVVPSAAADSDALPGLALLSIVPELPANLALLDPALDQTPASVPVRRVRRSDARGAFRGKHAARPAGGSDAESGDVGRPVVSPPALGKPEEPPEAGVPAASRNPPESSSAAVALSDPEQSDGPAASEAPSALQAVASDISAAPEVLAPADVPEGRADRPSAVSSIMFDAPPESIGEGMRQAEQAHRRSFAFKVAGGVAAGVLGVSLAVFVATHLPLLPEGPLDAGAGNRGTASQKQDDAMQGDDAASANATSPERDLSGTVVYRYIGTGAKGEGSPTLETVTFGSDGMCKTSSLEVELADEAAAREYLVQMQRDFGSSYQEGSALGPKALVTIDVSANKLDREGYEDALRISVQDLAIVRKS